MSVAAILASLIFVVCLILIFTEKINSTIVVFVGGTLMLALGQVIGFYSMDTAIDAMDFETLGLLMSMMILVSIIGSSAGILVTSISEKTHTPITSGLWNLRGVPTMFLACTIASLMYIIFYSTL